MSARPLGRPRKSESKLVQVGFRLPPELIAELDDHAVRMARKNPGLTFSRVDALKSLLADALGRAKESDEDGKR